MTPSLPARAPGSLPDGAATLGHVFVVRGRLESTASDALIVPTSSRFVPRETWWRALKIDGKPLPAAADTGNHADRVRRFTSHGDVARPAWLLNVAHDGHQSVQWLTEGLAVALREVEANRPDLGDGRVRPLVALPTLGVGLGGYDGVRGEVIDALLETTQTFVEDSDFDVVFVVENAADYAAMQSIRREKSPGRADSTSLAKIVRGGDVAFLLGAGVSVSAGLPTWDALLQTLKQDTLPHLSDDEFSKLGVLDRAQLLSKSSGDMTLGERAAEATGASEAKLPTLAHCLLASLAVGKAVTTNYDTLYEEAYRAAHGPKSISILPREEATTGRSWLLKMHGDVAAPGSIVLSRRDFVQYDAERRPLGSIVQSLMATGHLIVIGASMTDDNVLRLAHEVLAMNDKNKQRRALGTVVTLQSDPLRAALWEGEFHYLEASTSSDMNIAARDLEILLDGVAMHASSGSPFLLDARYDELLNDEETDIAAQLRNVGQRIVELPHRRRERWKTLHEALTSMGQQKSLAQNRRDRSLLTFDDLVDAYFSADLHKDHVDELRDYHNLKRDILIDLFGCPLPDYRAGYGETDRERDRNSVVRMALSCLRQASAISSPFGYYLEGGPGPLEAGLTTDHRRSFEAAREGVALRYRKIFEDALRVLHPGCELQEFSRSMLFARGLPREEPSDLFDFL